MLRPTCQLALLFLYQTPPHHARHSDAPRSLVSPLLSSIAVHVPPPPLLVPNIKNLASLVENGQIAATITIFGEHHLGLPWFSPSKLSCKSTASLFPRVVGTSSTTVDPRGLLPPPGTTMPQVSFPPSPSLYLPGAPLRPPPPRLYKNCSYFITAQIISY
jgi:hypothetical protein